MLCLISSFVVVLSLVSTVSCDTVATADDLISLFKHATGNTLQTDIEVAADLDFSSSNLTLPLGAFSNGTCVAFSGVFQGNGHTIKGLKMDNTDNEGHKDAGLFCTLNNATVENLVVDSSCSFTGYSAGALSVSVNGSLTVKNVTNNADVNGTEDVGGFVGFVEDLKQQTAISFEYCVNHGSVTGNDTRVGGFVGLVSGNTNTTMTISNSLNNGDVTGNGVFIGLFIGCIYGNTNTTVTISNSTINGSATGNDYIGGFVGYVWRNTNTTVTIFNSINNGSVTSGSSV